jgi:hypothetical protein
MQNDARETARHLRPRRFRAARSPSSSLTSRLDHACSRSCTTATPTSSTTTTAPCARTVAEHGGQEVHTEGDAFFVSPSRARTDAIAAAVAAQRALAAHRWPEGVDPARAHGPPHGRAPRSAPTTTSAWTSIAPRASARPHTGGQVLVSSATHELVVAELAGRRRTRWTSASIGSRTWTARTAVPDRRGRARSGVPPAALEAPANGASVLPPAPNRTIGRDDDVRAIVAGFAAAGVRLLTLTGPGGVGKTRLAVEAARAMEPDYADGARFVSLAPLNRHEDVAQAIVDRPGDRRALR